MDRTEKLLSQIDITTQTGLEFGPLDRPFVTKIMGDIYYIDQKPGEVTRQEMRNCEGIDPNICIDNIVDVDFIWDGRPLKEIVADNNGQPKTFDYAIASHVIEHVPDMVRWLQDVAAVLKDGGIFSLIIPDKRFCLDYLRPLTTMADLMNAYFLEAKVPLPNAIFEAVELTVELDAGFAWQGRIDPDRLKRISAQPLRYAYRTTRDICNDKLYYHCHCWVFTPKSFFELIEKMIRLDLFDFRIAAFYPTAPNTLEFFVALEKMPAMPDKAAYRKIQLDSLPKGLSDNFEPQRVKTAIPSN